MKIILASSNKGKIREIKEYCDYEVVAFSEIIEPFEIVEDGDTFQDNALIKARAIYEKVKDIDNEFIVLADDSGISVPLLGGEPGIYSARYAGEGASDRDNLEKLVEKLKEQGISSTSAYYTAAMAMVDDNGREYCVHGWMHGKVIDKPRGSNGFGYDPIFVPEGYDETLGELDSSVKKAFSHRSRAIELVRVLLKSL